MKESSRIVFPEAFRASECKKKILEGCALNLRYFLMKLT